MRIEKVMNVSIAREVERWNGGWLVLATVGSRALRRPVSARLGHHVELPVDRGLEKHSLAVVAPGIAEALFATAIGLSPPFRRLFSTISHFRGEPAGQRLEGFARRIFSNPVAPDRRAGVGGGYYYGHIGRYHNHGDEHGRFVRAVGGRRSRRKPDDGGSTSRRWST